MTLQPKLKEYFYDYNGVKSNKSKKWLLERTEIVKMINGFLKAGKIALGKSGRNFDEERLPIDTIVIHHSSTSSNAPIALINTLGLIRLYAPVFSSKKDPNFEKPIWSNHFYKNKPTFAAYHYIIRGNGTFVRLLEDNEIGWHAGNWDINRKSIAICFLGDLMDKWPTKEALNTAVKIIKKYPKCNILGHREVKSSTICPGNLFLGKNGWKKNLVLNA